MPLSHAKLWKALDALARREGASPSGLARRAGLDATSFNPSKRFGPGQPPRPRWPSTESLMQVLATADLSLGAFADLAGDMQMQTSNTNFYAPPVRAETARTPAERTADEVEALLNG